MSDSDNDSEKFFDAEEGPYTPDKTRSKLVLDRVDEEVVTLLSTPEGPPTLQTNEELMEAQRLVLETELHQRKMEEKLRLLEAEEEEVGRGDSEVSSLAGSSLAPEPDLVASTKSESPPVAPPRRRHRPKKVGSSSDKVEQQRGSGVTPQLLSPTVMVECLTKELEKSLDLESATRGQYVVKPQDREQDHGDYASSTSPAESRPMSSGPGSTHSSSGGSNNSHSYRTPDGTRSPHPMKMRSDSGRPLTDMEILEQVTVRNLDTGELIPLSQAEDRLPQGINPLSLHIMRLTSEYVSNPELHKSRDSDEESICSKKSGTTTLDSKRPPGKRIPQIFHRTFGLFRHNANEKHTMSTTLSEEMPDARFQAKTKAPSSHKGPFEFDGVRIVQELEGEHEGAVWTMKFSSCGRLLASAGQDRILRIWILKSAFLDFQNKKTSEGKEPPPLPLDIEFPPDLEIGDGPFLPKPICIYRGHTADLLDVSWSKNYFILSSSMDKTVRLWHISRHECLCCFQHIDFVTSIAFHPRDDRYFLSGSLDGKLRLWNIPDKKVALWNELDGHSKLITAVSFCQNGRIAVVGSYDGRCVLYLTEQLRYSTQIHVRSTRGKNAKGRKITSVEPMPGEDKILVTSNDSRIRLYDIRDLSLSCKYKGYVNTSSQIKASFSHDGKYIISGSENQLIYIWRTSHDVSKLTSVRRDRNDFWESIKAHDVLVTSAVFAPRPAIILDSLELSSPRYVIVSADFNGCIKVMVNHCPAPQPPTSV